MKIYRGYIRPTANHTNSWYSHVPNFRNILLEVREDGQNDHYIVIKNEYNIKMLKNLSRHTFDTGDGALAYVRKENFKLLEDELINNHFKSLLSKEIF